jgi:hypothetical protein
VAERCPVALQDVALSSEHKELGNLQNQLDIQKIKEIIININLFIDETSASDRTVYQKVYQTPGPTKDEIDDFISIVGAFQQSQQFSF